MAMLVITRLGTCMYMSHGSSLIRSVSEISGRGIFYRGTFRNYDFGPRDWYFFRSQRCKNGFVWLASLGFFGDCFTRCSLVPQLVVPKPCNVSYEKGYPKVSKGHCTSSMAQVDLSSAPTSTAICILQSPVGVNFKW